MKKIGSNFRIIIITVLLIAITMAFIPIIVMANNTGTFYIDTQYNCKTFVGRTVVVKGWIMTSDATSQMKLYIDGQDTKTDFSTRTARPDVLSAISGYGGAEANPKPGFEGILDISSYSKGEHTVTYSLEQADGTIIYRESYQVNFDNEAKGTFDIDRPNIYGNTPITKETKLEVSGWFMSNDVNATMNVYIDGTKMKTTLTRTKRPDVLSAIQGYGGEELNPQPGFETTIDLTQVSHGTHKVTYQLETVDGKVLAQKSANMQIKKGEFYIDTQYNCKTFEGRTIAVRGWIMTSSPNSQMKIYIDGQDTKTDFSTRTARPDVISAISGYGGAQANPKPGFEGILDIGSYSKGEHTVTYSLEQADGTIIYRESYQVNFDNEAKGTFDIDRPNIYGNTPITKETKLEVSGWFMSNDVNATMNVYIDGTKMKTTLTRTKRPDVLSAIQGYGGEELNPQPGFETEIDLTQVSHGTHKVTYQLETADGKVLAQKSANVQIKKGEFYIDTQYNCKTFEGRAIAVRGWIMTSDLNSQMKIYIDGQDTKTDFSTRTARPDVLAGISGYGGAEFNPKPGFEGILNIGGYSKGEHTVTYSLEQADGTVIYRESYQVNFDNEARATLDIDEPNWKGVPNTDGKIIGWVMTNVKNVKIRVFIDQYERWDKQYREERPDVLAAITGYGSKENNPLPGFIIDIKYSDFALGTHTLRIVIQDQDTGEQIAVKTKEFTIYENSNGIAAFPESYQIMLRKIVQEKGMTNWKFVPVYTGIDWNDLTSTVNENQCLKNLVHESSPSTWKCSCGRYGDVEYVCASGKIVNYFLDPRNFLTQKAIFQFLDVSSTTVSVNQIQENVTGTFLQDSVNGVSYAQMLYDAQTESGENAFSIMSRIFQEIGRGSPGNPPAMVSGKNSVYPNTYNFFNYGATDGEGNTLRGLALAQKLGWDNPRTALIEGSKLIAKDYIQNNKQNTKYLFKFDVTQEGGFYNHQYMSNIEDPNSQASILFAAYNKGNLNSNLTFAIPIYDNMPAYVKLPSDLTGDLYYISSDYDSVGFRTGPGIGYTAVSGCERLRKDSVVKMLQSGINGWAKVEYDGKIGYVTEEYLTPVNRIKD